MKILYVYPHPDDESFGPAPALAMQRRQGHKVYLLTLTRGGATKQRFKFNYSIEEMGRARYEEMQNVAKVLDFNGLNVLDFPDSGLKEVDPREIERVIREEIFRIKPHILATYPVHGISGFHDHLVTHAAVKRVFVELKDEVPSLQRLAFETISEEDAARFETWHLNGSKAEDIDCITKPEQVDVERGMKALDCYVTYQDTIEKTNIKDFMKGDICFEIFQENFDPPLSNLFDGLKAV